MASEKKLRTTPPWRLARDVVRVVQVAKPHLGREVLRLRVRKIVALVNLDGQGLAQLMALIELLGLAPDPRRLLGRRTIGRDERRGGGVDVDGKPVGMNIPVESVMPKGPPVRD